MSLLYGKHAKAATPLLNILQRCHHLTPHATTLHHHCSAVVHVTPPTQIASASIRFLSLSLSHSLTLFLSSSLIARVTLCPAKHALSHTHTHTHSRRLMSVRKLELAKLRHDLENHLNIGEAVEKLSKLSDGMKSSNESLLTSLHHHKREGGRKELSSKLARSLGSSCLLVGLKRLSFGEQAPSGWWGPPSPPQKKKTPMFLTPCHANTRASRWFWAVGGVPLDRERVHAFSEIYRHQ